MKEKGRKSTTVLPVWKPESMSSSLYRPWYSLDWIWSDCCVWGFSLGEKYWKWKHPYWLIHLLLSFDLEVQLQSLPGISRHFREDCLAEGELTAGRYFWYAGGWERHWSALKGALCALVYRAKELIFRSAQFITVWKVKTVER